MRRSTREYDIRGAEAIRALFPRAARRGYWFKVDREAGARVLAALAAAYGVPPPVLSPLLPSQKCNGEYWLDTQTIRVHGRAHLKTYFHEFYHHLENMDRDFDSSDRLRLAWGFAERMWFEFRQE